MRQTSGSVITADSEKIFYNHYQASKPAVIVIAHGFFNSKDSVLIKRLAGELGKDFDIITFDFRGHGKSKGRFYWTAKEHLDLEAILNFASSDYERIALIGFSLGAASSIITLSRLNMVNSFIAISSPSELRKIDYQFWNLDIENDILYNLGEGRYGKGVRPGPFWLKKHKPITLISRVKTPVFYIHGDADWVIKPWHSKRLYEKTTSEKDIAIIKNGPHAEYLMRKQADQLLRLIRQWFQKTLMG